MAPSVEALPMQILLPTGRHLVLAADAAIEVQGSNGKRRIKATDFFTGLFSTALQDDEIIIAIRIPVPPNGTKTTYQKFEQPASRFAIVGCAVMRLPDGKTNIAFTGVADMHSGTAMQKKHYLGKAINNDSIHAAVMLRCKHVDILSDHYASKISQTFGKSVFEKSFGSNCIIIIDSLHENKGGVSAALFCLRNKPTESRREKRSCTENL